MEKKAKIQKQGKKKMCIRTKGKKNEPITVTIN
jgi:hypothetical protein